MTDLNTKKEMDRWLGGPSQSPAVKSAREWTNVSISSRAQIQNSEAHMNPDSKRIRLRILHGSGHGSRNWDEPPAPPWAKILFIVLIATGLAFFALGMLFF